MNSSLLAENSKLTFTIDKALAGQRLDAFACDQLPGYSRTFIQKMIKTGAFRINDKTASKASTCLKEHDEVMLTVPEQTKPAPVSTHTTNDFGVTILFEHEHFLIINKPAGLMTHAATTTNEPSLVDWITQQFEEIRSVGAIDRPGIVHRLDKETSGIMVIARTNYAHQQFTTFFKDKTISKTYLALVHGHPEKAGIVQLPIGRHPTLRHKMHAFGPKEPNQPAYIRQAMTEYEVKNYYLTDALVQAKPITGRTHQIRVHLAAIGHSLIGDHVYGKKSTLIARHALHAYSLSFTFEGTPFNFICQPASDFLAAQEQLAN